MNKKHKIEQQKALIKDLTKNLPGAIDSFKTVNKSAEKIINTMITPNIKAQMTPDQRELFDSVKQGLKMDGGDLGERLNKITQTLDRYANGNK